MNLRAISPKIDEIAGATETIREITEVEEETIEVEVETEEAAEEPQTRRRWIRSGLQVVAAAGALAVGFATWRVLAPARPLTSNAVIASHGAIFVGPFENRTGDAEADWLRLGLPDMLITGLSQGEGMTVLGRSELDRVLSRRGWLGRRLTLEDILNAARGANASLAIAGSFAAVGSELRIDTQIYDTADGRLIGGDTTVIADRARLLTDVVIVTAKVSARLGRPARAPATLTTVMTDDLDAYREYSLAVDRVANLRYVEAIELLERAVRRDPDFAMAYARIGYSYGVAGNDHSRARPYLQEAFKRSERLTDIEIAA